VRVCWWRALHPALLAVPVLQALLSRACFLTQAILEQEAGARASQEPLIARLVKSVIFWPLPIWFSMSRYGFMPWCYGGSCRRRGAGPRDATPAAWSHGRRGAGRTKGIGAQIVLRAETGFPAFARTIAVERIATGFRWAEGPA
jgi:hypothetical protein